MALLWEATISEAYQKAFDTDSVSAFGGIVALNRPIDAATATTLTKTFLECIVAPGCEPEAEEIIKKESQTTSVNFARFDSRACTNS